MSCLASGAYGRLHVLSAEFYNASKAIMTAVARLPGSDCDGIHGLDRDDAEVCRWFSRMESCSLKDATDEACADADKWLREWTLVRGAWVKRASIGSAATSSVTGGADGRSSPPRPVVPSTRIAAAATQRRRS